MILLLMIAGAGAVYWVIQLVYRKVWNKKLSADISFSADNVVAGEYIELVEVVTNKKRMPLPYIHLKFQADRSLVFGDGNENSQVTDKTYRNDIFSLLMYQRITRRIPLLCSKRGVYTIDKLDMISTGIFMNEVLIVNCPVNEEVVVYPKIADVEMLEVIFSKLMGSIERSKYLYEDPFVFRGIRDYTPIDPMNTINWKASARTGSFMVNQFNETMCQEVCILLDVESESMIKRDDLSEISISIAAGLSQMLIEKGISVSVITNGADYVSGEYISTETAAGPAQLRVINTVLARIDLKREPVNYIKLISDVIKPESENRDKQCVYVMIAQNKRADLQQAFDELTGGRSECMWIITADKDEEPELKYTKAAQVLYREQV